MELSKILKDENATLKLVDHLTKTNVICLDYVHNAHIMYFLIVVKWLCFQMNSESIILCNLYLNPNYKPYLKLALTVNLTKKSSWLMGMLFHNQQGCWSREVSNLSKLHLTLRKSMASVYVVIYISRLIYEPLQTSAVVVDHPHLPPWIFYTKLCVIACGLSDLQPINVWWGQILWFICYWWRIFSCKQWATPCPLCI